MTAHAHQVDIRPRPTRLERLQALADRLERDGCHAEIHPRGYVLALEPDLDPQDPRTEWDADEDAPEVAAYMEGDVCGWVVYDAAGAHLDSCWGFYGEHDYPLAQAREHADTLPNMTRGASRFPRLSMAGAR